LRPLAEKDRWTPGSYRGVVVGRSVATEALRDGLVALWPWPLQSL
jgi:hypothetical protein